MKLTTTNKHLSDTPKTYTRLVLIEKGSERFVEKEGVTELQLCGGKLGDITPRTFRTLMRAVVQCAKKYKIEKLAIELKKSDFKKLKGHNDAWFLSTIAENFMLANYEFSKYKSKKETNTLTEICICSDMNKAALSGFKHGQIVGAYTNICRDVANTPGGDMTPALLAAEAKKALKGTETKVTVLDEKQIAKLKMGGILGVGKGAKDKPRFIVIEYWGLKKPVASSKKSMLQKKESQSTHENGQSGRNIDEHKQGGRNIDEHNPIVFVGKGITFDTGGLQIKPGMSMYEMHMDMSGGAAVIAAIGAIAKLGIKKNVIGLIPAAENAVSDEAIRPGDVIRMMSGKTVDVLHTDAEGRLVLADALHYARKYNPRLVIDVATLTGAASVAVGQHANAIMTKDRKLEDTLRELGEESGDYTFPLPLWDEYKPYTKGVHGDIANIPSNDSRNGGAINGGMFLTHFTEGLRWAHIDMAPRMTAVASDKLARGATGEPTRLLINIAEKL